MPSEQLRLECDEPAIEDWQRRRTVMWMFECCDELHFDSTVSSTAIWMLECFLLCKRRAVQSDDIQLMAAVAMMVSSKLFDVETEGLVASDLEIMTDYTYTRNRIGFAERELLETLEWRLHFFSPSMFHPHLLSVLPADCLAGVSKIASAFEQAVYVENSIFAFPSSTVALASCLYAVEKLGFSFDTFVESIDRSLFDLTGALALKIRTQPLLERE